MLFRSEVGNSFPGIPVRITNDANAAALGEIAYGNAGGMRDFIMVTLGTGLGSGFVAGGRMIYGHDGMAGELPEDKSIILAKSSYGEELIAAVGKDNVVATQFHPEKSGDIGLKIIKNFVEG